MGEKRKEQVALTREEEWACLQALEKVIADTPSLSIPKRAVESARDKFHAKLKGD